MVKTAKNVKTKKVQADNAKTKSTKTTKVKAKTEKAKTEKAKTEKVKVEKVVEAKPVTVEKTKMPASIRILGIIAAILMSILGILLFIRPIATGVVVLWLSVAGLLVCGIYGIIKYCKTPKELREGATLGLSILWIIISVLLILAACNAPIVTTENILLCVAVMIGIMCIFSGIGSLCTCGLRGSVAWGIVSGILELLCGIAILSAPLFGLFSLTIIFGIYLLIMGIVLLIKSIFA